MCAPSPRSARGEGWGEGRSTPLTRIVFSRRSLAVAWCLVPHPDPPLRVGADLSPRRAGRGEKKTRPYIIPDSSSSACSISAALTTTSRRGIRKTMVDAQAIDNAKTAALSGAGVEKWPPR